MHHFTNDFSRSTNIAGLFNNAIPQNLNLKQLEMVQFYHKFHAQNYMKINFSSEKDLCTLTIHFLVQIASEKHSHPF